MFKIAILTNSWAADQRSMIGYGELLLSVARKTGAEVVEWRGASFFGKLPLSGIWRKLALNLDRFMLTPLKLIGRRADLVHVVDPGNCIYLPLTRHQHSIVTVHDLIPYLALDGKLPPGWRPTLFGRCLMGLIIRQLSKTSHIICVSNATKRDLLAYVPRSDEDVSIIYNAVFQTLEPAGSEACNEIRARLRIPNDAPLIMHIGRNWYKNREAVLNVVAKVREQQSNVHLVLVGDLSPPLRNQIDCLGLADVTRVILYLPSADIAALYTAATVLLFPSHYEGFGLPVLEARMCGTPVVCSTGGSLPEVAQEHEVAISHEEMVLKILKHIDQQQETNLRSKAEIQISETFSLPRWNADHIDFYLKLAGRSNIS